MADRSVTVRLKAEIGQYEQGMKQAATAAEQTGRQTQKAGEAAEKAGRSFKGAVGDVDKYGNALSEADVAAGRYVNKGGLVAEANGQMAAGFGKTRQATEEATASAEKATGAWGSLTETAQRNEQAWDRVSTVLLGAGAASVAGVGLAVKTFADYDSAMSSVRAATHASEEDMAALGDAAIKAGADTAFSAEEAARGIEELAKAGVSTSDILGGGLDGALALAAAGSLEVGDAAEIAASALTQFKLGGEDVGHIADLLAAGAGKAQGSVKDMGDALNQTGIVASQTGLTIEETTGGLAAFASAGLVGSDAGTSFKTMLQRLNPQSEAAATLMDELGLSAYDSQGNFIGLSEYAGKLQTALQGMSEEQRAATMNTLFGSDAVRAAGVLYEQGAEGVQEWEDAVNDAGYAAETAALMQDNLAGDIEKLGGAIDTAFLKSGSGMNDALRGMVQGAEGAVDAIGRIPAPVLTASAAITGVTGAAALGAGAFMKVIPAVADTRQAMEDLGITGDNVKGKLGGVAKAVGIATVAFGGFELAAWAGKQGQPAIDSLDVLAQKITDAGTGALDLDAAFEHMADGAVGSGREIRGLDDAMDLKYGGGFRNFMLGVGDALPGVENEMSHVNNQFEGFDDILAGMVNSGNAEEAAAGWERIAARGRELGIPLEQLKRDFPQYAAALETAAEESAGAASGAEAVAGGLEDVAAESEEAALSLEEVVDALRVLGMIEMDARTATSDFSDALRGVPSAIQEIIDAEGKMGPILNQMGTDFDLTSEAGARANQAFQDIATSGWDLAEATANAGGSFEDIQGDLQGTYDGLINAAAQFGITGEAADVLARTVLGVPDGVSIETWMSDSALQMAETTGAAASELDGTTVSIDTYMSDAAFREALDTRAAALNIPTDVAVSSFMEDYARDKAGDTTAAILGIPKGASVRSWMASDARGEAEALKIALENVDGKVVNTYANHHETVFVNTVDNGQTARREGTKRINQGRATEYATGGRAGLPAFADGGRLPSTGLGTDQILGISSVTGSPTAWVDDREWIINRNSSDKYNALLSAVNRDDPSIRHLARHATGARAGAREYTAAAVGAYTSRVSATVDTTGVEAAVARGLAGARVEFKVDQRTIHGIITDANRAAHRR